MNGVKEERLQTGKLVFPEYKQERSVPVGMRLKSKMRGRNHLNHAEVNMCVCLVDWALGREKVCVCLVDWALGREKVCVCLVDWALGREKGEHKPAVMIFILFVIVFKSIIFFATILGVLAM